MTDHRAVMRMALNMLCSKVVSSDDWNTVKKALRAALDAPDGDVVPVAWHPRAKPLEYVTRCTDGTMFLNVAPMPAHATEWSIPAHPPTPPQDADTVTVRLTREQHEDLCETVFEASQTPEQHDRLLALLGTFPDVGAE